jgi:hypothetical protein
MRTANSHSMCAVRVSASRRPTLSVHSRKIDESTSVSYHIAWPISGWLKASSLIASIGMNAPVTTVSASIEWSVVRSSELCRSTKSPGMDREDLPVAVAGGLVADGEAFEQHAASCTFPPPDAYWCARIERRWCSRSAQASSASLNISHSCNFAAQG